MPYPLPAPGGTVWTAREGYRTDLRRSELLFNPFPTANANMADRMINIYVPYRLYNLNRPMSP